MKIKRLIDRLLSSPGSAFGQFFLWLLLVVLTFLLLFGIRLLSRNLDVSMENMILQFINPANYFPDSSPEEYSLANRRLSLITGLFGLLIMTGLFIPCVSNIIFRRVENIQNGQISYHFKNHYIIIGFNEMTASIILQLCERNKKIDIVIQTSQNVQDVRNKLEVELDKEHLKQLVFMHGAGNSEQDVKKLHTKNAKRIIILGDNNSEAHDAYNMKCLEEIVFDLSRYGKKIKRIECDMLLNDQASYTILKKINFDKNWSKEIVFRPFNFHETWAQKVIVHNKVFISGTKKINYIPLEGNSGIQHDTDKNVHFVILGLKKMGMALGIEAARTMHFPNFIRNNSLKTHITFIDPDIDKQMNLFISRYPHLFELVDFDYTDTTQKEIITENITQYKNKNLEFNDFLDVQFSFIKGDFESPLIKKLICDWTEDNSVVLTIAVCLDDTEECMAAGLFLPPAVFLKEIPVYIQQKEISCMFTEMINKDNKYKIYKNVRPFGMVNECFSIEDIRNVEKNAKYVMWIYNTFQNYRAPENKGGKGYNFDTAIQMTRSDIIENEDIINEKWYELAVAKRWSNINNAFSINVKNRSFNINETGILKSDIDLLAEVEHNRWNIERLIFGYRATTKEENIKITSNRENKNKYIDEDFAHFDIRPYKYLDFDSNGIKTDEYDICISDNIQKIIGKG